MPLGSLFITYEGISAGELLQLVHAGILCPEAAGNLVLEERKEIVGGSGRGWGEGSELLGKHLLEIAVIEREGVLGPLALSMR